MDAPSLARGGLRSVVGSRLPRRGCAGQTAGRFGSARACPRFCGTASMAWLPMAWRPMLLRHPLNPSTCVLPGVFRPPHPQGRHPADGVPLSLLVSQLHPWGEGRGSRRAILGAGRAAHALRIALPRLEGIRSSRRPAFIQVSFDLHTPKVGILPTESPHPPGLPVAPLGGGPGGDGRAILGAGRLAVDMRFAWLGAA
jgi:hypothetical protein